MPTRAETDTTTVSPDDGGPFKACVAAQHLRARGQNDVVRGHKIICGERAEGMADSWLLGVERWRARITTIAEIEAELARAAACAPQDDRGQESALGAHHGSAQGEAPARRARTANSANGNGWRCGRMPSEGDMNWQDRRKAAARRRYLDTMIAEGGGKPHDPGTKFLVKLQIITMAGLLTALGDTKASAAKKDDLQIVERLERRRQQGRLECGTCDRKLAFADFDDVLIIRPYNDHATTGKAAPLCRACAARPLSELTVAAAQAVFGKDFDVLLLELPGLFPRSGRA